MNRQTLKTQLLSQRDPLAQSILTRHLTLDPTLQQRYTDHMKARCLEDVRYHLTFLAEAIGTNTPSIFVDYIEWAKTVLVTRKVNIPEISYNLEIMRDVLAQKLGGDLKAEVTSLINLGISTLHKTAPDTPVIPLHELTRQYIDTLLNGNRRVARDLVLGAVQQGMPLKDIYIDVLQAAQIEIGNMWHLNKISVAHEHFCTAATQSIMSELYPYLAVTPRNDLRLVAAAAPGEIHELGLRMVADFFEMDGWDTYYIGSSTPLNSLLSLVEEQRPHVLALSASTALNLSSIGDAIEKVKQLPNPPRVMVGGRIFNQNPNLWTTLNADAYAPDAPSAITTANSLIQQ